VGIIPTTLSILDMTGFSDIKRLLATSELFIKRAN
jgi:hypothetical protein